MEVGNPEVIERSGSCRLMSRWGIAVALRAIWRRSFGVIWRTKVKFENSRGEFKNDSIISIAWLFVISDSFDGQFEGFTDGGRLLASQLEFFFCDYLTPISVQIFTPNN
jgi:hypothetical protein